MGLSSWAIKLSMMAKALSLPDTIIELLRSSRVIVGRSLGLALALRAPECRSEMIFCTAEASACLRG